MSRSELPSGKPLFVRLVEWIGTHPFVTGLMAIVGLVGFAFSVFAFQDEKASSAADRVQSEQLAGEISAQGDASKIREEAIAGSLEAMGRDASDRDTDIIQKLDRIADASPKTPTDRIPSIFDLPYDQARAALIASGWIPSKKRWQDIGDLWSVPHAIWQYGFQEIDDCSGTGEGYCRWLWQDAESNLLVVVTSQHPDGEMDPGLKTYFTEPGFANVKVVRFFFES